MCVDVRDSEGSGDAIVMETRQEAEMPSLRLCLVPAQLPAGRNKQQCQHLVPLKQALGDCIELGTQICCCWSTENLDISWWGGGKRGDLGKSE